MTDDLVTDGATSFEATHEGLAMPIPAGETIHTEKTSIEPISPASIANTATNMGIVRPEVDRTFPVTPGEDVLVSHAEAFAQGQATGLRVAPVTLPSIANVTGSVSMVPAKTALDFQRLLTLALDHVPLRETGLREQMAAAIRVRVDQ